MVNAVCFETKWRDFESTNFELKTFLLQSQMKEDKEIHSLQHGLF